MATRRRQAVASSSAAPADISGDLKAKTKCAADEVGAAATKAAGGGKKRPRSSEPKLKPKNSPASHGAARDYTDGLNSSVAVTSFAQLDVRIAALA